MQGTQLLQSAAEGDSALLLGGDLIVTVHRAEQLCGQERLTHPFARVSSPWRQRAVVLDAYLHRDAKYSGCLCLGATSRARWEAIMLAAHSGTQHRYQGWLGCTLQVRVGDQTNITNVLWQTVSPEWDEAVFFREICAASELVVEVWDVGGSKKSEQLQRLAEEPGRLVSNSRFLGRVEVPLSETLSLKRGAWGVR